MMHASALFVVLVTAASCDAREPREPGDGPPVERPNEAQRPAEALTDQELADLFVRTQSAGREVTGDPGDLCFHRIDGAPKYVQIGRRSGRRSGAVCRSVAVCYERACELVQGDFNRFEASLLADLGWRDASREEREALLLRWLREARFAFATGPGPFLVDGELAAELGLSEPVAFERDGMPKLSYWTREMRRTRERPDDYYWVLHQWEHTFDPLDGRPIGRGERDERRMPME